MRNYVKILNKNLRNIKRIKEEELIIECQLNNYLNFKNLKRRMDSKWIINAKAILKFFAILKL